MTKVLNAAAIGLALTAGLLAACHRVPSPDRPIEAPSGNSGGSGKSLDSKDLTLKKGLEIKVTMAHGVRTLTIDNPSGAEGLTFDWQAEEKSGASESRPSKSLESSGKMTLANTVDGRRMTLPAFWPGGELFLSNSSAVWLSDRAFSELKKDGKTQWTIGLLDNPLVGPLQDDAMVEGSLESANRALENKPDKRSSAQELKVTDKSADYPIKLNGVAGKVDVIEAENWLGRLKILDNAQNPLILQFEVTPQAKGILTLFSPLSWIRDKLDYRVEEISLK